MLASGTYSKVCPAFCDCSHMKLCCPHVYVVYSAKKYIECVAECAELSMGNAVESVKQLPHYEQEGEVCNVPVLL